MTDLEKIILSLEKTLMLPEVRHSADKLAGILSESFFEFGTSGRMYHYHKGDVFEGGPVNDTDWEIRDFAVNSISQDCVLATYSAVKHTEPDESKKVSRRCSLWEIESGSWKIKYHQGAIAE